MIPITVGALKLCAVPLYVTVDEAVLLVTDAWAMLYAASVVVIL